MSDTVTITVTGGGDTVSITTSVNAGVTYQHIKSDNPSSVSSVASGLTLADYTARADVADRISVFSGGRKRMYNEPWGWGVSGNNFTFLGADGSTAVNLLNEYYEIIIRTL